MFNFMRYTCYAHVSAIAAAFQHFNISIVILLHSVVLFFFVLMIHANEVKSWQNVCAHMSNVMHVRCDNKRYIYTNTTQRIYDREKKKINHSRQSEEKKKSHSFRLTQENIYVLIEWQFFPLFSLSLLFLRSVLLLSNPIETLSI